MRINLFLALIIVAICSSVISAQSNDVVASFEKNKEKYKLEKFAEGEDASSGYDYLFYKTKDQIVKVRVIWSSSANPNFTIEDYFYDGGKLATVIKYDLAKKNYKNARLGRSVPLKETDFHLLSGEQLTFWKEKSKPVSNKDPRWQETEKLLLENGKNYLTLYEDLKEN